MKILILYYELAYYNIPCFKELAKDNELFLIKYDVNKLEAPFNFLFDFPINVFSSNEMKYDDLFEMSQKIQPDIIFCAGWNNKSYLKLCIAQKNAVKILGFDTISKGSLVLKIKYSIFNRRFAQVFNFAFVPGLAQKNLALKMGFNNNQIKLGAYSCDFNYYKSIGQQFNEIKKKSFPKRFIFVGRYIERKGIYDLWDSFKQLQIEKPNNWELWCVGTGPLYEHKMIHPKIKHFGFLQPDKIVQLMKETSVFILPSHYEPWGVVVHEFASAGFPLILSDKITSASAFLEENVNGFSFESNNPKSLKEVLTKTLEIKDYKLIQMGEISVKLASKINPEKWAKTFIDV